MLSKEDNMKEVQRLRWQCRRGMLELDYLLEGYLDEHFEKVSDEERQSFKHLLDQHDLDLQRWLLLSELPDDKSLVSIVGKVRGDFSAS